MRRLVGSVKAADASRYHVLVLPGRFAGGENFADHIRSVIRERSA